MPKLKPSLIATTFTALVLGVVCFPYSAPYKAPETTYDLTYTMKQLDQLDALLQRFEDTTSELQYITTKL